MLIIAAFSPHVSAQVKSIEAAQEEAAGTTGISVAYDESRYLTLTSVTVDSIPANEPLKKQFRKFEWKLETWFAIKGIDAKPARVVLCLATQSKRFVFASDRELTLAFDGDDVLLGEAQRSTEVKGGKARETLCWEVDEVITRDFTKSASASFAIGRTRGTFSAADLNAFKAYGMVVSVEE